MLTAIIINCWSFAVIFLLSCLYLLAFHNCSSVIPIPTCTRHYFKHYSWEPKLRSTVKNIHVDLLFFSSSEVSDSLWHLRHTWLLCPPLYPRVYSTLCPLSLWCYLTISSYVAFFSFCQWVDFCLFQWVDSSSHQVAKLFRISHSKEYFVLISFRTDLFNILTVQGTLKRLLQYHSSKASIIQCSAFFIDQLSLPYMTTENSIALTILTFVSKVMSLLFNMLSRSFPGSSVLKNLPIYFWD